MSISHLLIKSPPEPLQPPIGILGGTFDPIHLGHLRMALELYEKLDLARVHVIPCFSPVHRENPVALPKQRLTMVKKAVASEEIFYADDIEVKRQTPSFTTDTLQMLRETLPHTPLVLFLGIDAFLSFLNWERAENILMQCHLAIATRPGYTIPIKGALAKLLKAHACDKTYLHQHQAGGILLMPTTALEISSTYIRQQIAAQKNPRYLLPESVYRYILEHNIYNKVN